MQLKKLISDTKRFEWRLHRTTDPQGPVPPIAEPQGQSIYVHTGATAQAPNVLLERLSVEAMMPLHCELDRDIMMCS